MRVFASYLLTRVISNCIFVCGKAFNVRSLGKFELVRVRVAHDIGGKNNP